MKHVHIWRELPRMNAGRTLRKPRRRDDGMIVYCVTDAKQQAERIQRDGSPRERALIARGYPVTDEVEFFTPRAAAEFRKQRRAGIEPRFDDEGLVMFVIRQRSGPRQDRRAQSTARPGSAHTARG